MTHVYNNTCQDSRERDLHSRRHEHEKRKERDLSVSEVRGLDFGVGATLKRIYISPRGGCDFCAKSASLHTAVSYLQVV